MKKKLLSLGFIGSLVTFLACVPSLRDARSKEQAGLFQESLRLYRNIASDRTHRDAPQAQIGVIRLLTRAEKWKELPVAFASLVGFLDSEDEWSEKYTKEVTFFARTREHITRFLRKIGNQSFLFAHEKGDPFALHASLSAYSSVLRFSRGNASRELLAEASIRKGYLLALRNDCSTSMPLFRKGLRLLDASSSKRALQQTAHRGLFHCQVKSYVKKRRKKTLQAILFSLKRLPIQKKTAIDIVEHTKTANKHQAWDLSLQLNMTFLQKFPNHPLQRRVQANILQLFGRIKDWSSFLKELNSIRDKVQHAKSFWKKVDYLSQLTLTRKLQRSLRDGGSKESVLLQVQGLLIRKDWDENKLLLLYKLGLRLEQRRHYRSARRLYRFVFTKSKNKKVAPMAWYRYAFVLEKTGYRFQAARWYESLSFRYMKSIIASRSMYRAWMIYKQAGKKKKTKQLRKMIRRLFPASMEARRLR